MAAVKPAYDYLRKRLETRIAKPEERQRAILTKSVANENIAFLEISNPASKHIVETAESRHALQTIAPLNSSAAD
jgi:hypothetical protein